MLWVSGRQVMRFFMIVVLILAGAIMAVYSEAGQGVEFFVMKDFDLSALASSASYKTFSASKLLYCIIECTSAAGCGTVTYDENTGQCMHYDTIFMRKISSVPTTVSVLQPFCAATEGEDCCKNSNPLCGGPIYIDCHDAFIKGDKRNGAIYYIQPDPEYPYTMKVVCEFDETNGWTLFQRRLDGSIDFYRDWADYEAGFGQVKGEYWLGLENLYWLTKSNSKLRIDLEAHDGERRYAVYDSFYIDDKNSSYKLHVSNYSGDAGNAFTSHNLMMFTTRDVDNDLSSSNCAVLRHAAFWYKACNLLNPNGFWYPGGDFSSQTIGTGAVWGPWKGYYYSMKTYVMKLTH